MLFYYWGESLREGGAQNPLPPLSPQLYEDGVADCYTAGRASADCYTESRGEPWPTAIRWVGPRPIAIRGPHGALLAEKCAKVHFLAKMGPSGARAPKPNELLSFWEPPGSPNGPKVHFFAKSALFRISGSREVVKTTVFIPTFDMGAKSCKILVGTLTFAKSAISALSGAKISGPRPLLFAFGRFW